MHKNTILTGKFFYANVLFWFRIDAQILVIFSKSKLIPQAVGQTWQVVSQTHVEEAQAEEVAGLCICILSKEPVLYFQITQRNYFFLSEEQIPIPLYWKIYNCLNYLLTKLHHKVKEMYSFQHILLGHHH